MNRAPVKKKGEAGPRRQAASRSPVPGPLSPAFSDLRYDAQGLVAAIVQDADTGAVLMLGYMDREALGATIESGEVHFHSRSRGVLWRKGETSGNVLRLVAIAADCDGDALLVQARPAGPTCHTGETSCFHRDVQGVRERASGLGARGASRDRAGGGGSAADSNVIARSRAEGGATKQSPCSGQIASSSDPPPADRTPRNDGGFEEIASLPVPPAAARASRNDSVAEKSPKGRREGLDLAPLFAVLKDRAERRPEGSYTVKLLGNEDKALKKLIEEAGEVALAVKNRDRANLVWELADVLYHLAVIMVAQDVAPADVNAELARRAGETR